MKIKTHFSFAATGLFARRTTLSDFNFVYATTMPLTGYGTKGVKEFETNKDYHVAQKVLAINALEGRYWSNAVQDLANKLFTKITFPEFMEFLENLKLSPPPGWLSDEEELSAILVSVLALRLVAVDKKNYCVTIDSESNWKDGMGEMFDNRNLSSGLLSTYPAVDIVQHNTNQSNIDGEDTTEYTML